MDDAPGPFDDAALVRAEPASETGLVMTIDVVTPMVDDAETFGAIAAANALSDVWAMGGTPQVALSFIGFPSDVLPLEDLAAIARGLGRTAEEAGCAIVGGHTLIDPEPKAGLSVTGVVERARVWSHRRGEAGQALVLSKAIGTGVIVQSMKKGAADPAVADGAVRSMLRLNRAACEAGRAHGATAATDITGFGLLGHLSHLARASGVRARLDAAAVPLLAGARALAEAGVAPGGSRKNLAFVAPHVAFSATVEPALQLLLADAQTSGGLLLCVPEREAAALVARLRDEGHDAARVGELLPPDEAAPLIRID